MKTKKLSARQLRSLIIKESSLKEVSSDEYAPGRWDLLVADAIKEACEEEWDSSYDADDPIMAHSGENSWQHQVQMALAELDDLDVLEFSSVGEFLERAGAMVKKTEDKLFAGDFGQ